MLNVTEDLRKKIVKMPEPDVFDAGADAEPIEIISLSMSDCKKIELKANQARVSFIDAFDGSEDTTDLFADVEYNNTLKYWAVVYALAVDEEAAYKLNGLDQVRSYIDFYFGTKYNKVFEDLAIEVCSNNGLEIKSHDEPEETDESDSISTYP